MWCDIGQIAECQTLSVVLLHPQVSFRWEDVTNRKYQLLRKLPFGSKHGQPHAVCSGEK